MTYGIQGGRSASAWWLAAHAPGQTRDDKLIGDWKAGDSPSLIAARLGTTRNAVCGRARRLQHLGRIEPRRAGSNGPRLSRAPAHGHGVAHDLSARLPVIELPPLELSKTATCGWITGDPRRPDSTRCTQPAVRGRGFCAPHLVASHPHLNLANLPIAGLPQPPVRLARRWTDDGDD